MQLLLITDSLSKNLGEIFEPFISLLKYGSFEFVWKFDGSQKIKALQFQKTCNNKQTCFVILVSQVGFFCGGVQFLFLIFWLQWLLVFISHFPYNFLTISFLVFSCVATSKLLASGGNDLGTEILNSSTAILPKETFLNPHTSRNNIIWKIRIPNFKLLSDGKRKLNFHENSGCWGQGTVYQRECITFSHAWLDRAKYLSWKQLCMGWK